MPYLKDNWLHIATHAWSMWLWALALLFIILDKAAPFLQEAIMLPDWFFGIASGVLSAGGMIARLLVQQNIMETYHRDSQ